MHRSFGLFEIGLLLGEALELFAFGGSGRVVAGEDVLEDPGGSAPATTRFGGFEDDPQVELAEFFPSLEQGEGEVGVLSFPAA